MKRTILFRISLIKISTFSWEMNLEMYLIVWKLNIIIDQINMVLAKEEKEITKVIDIDDIESKIFKIF